MRLRLLHTMNHGSYDDSSGNWSNKDGRVEGDRAENITLNDISRRISLLPPVFCRCFRDQCWKSTCAPAHLISTCPASLWHWGKVDTREKREDGSGRPAVVRGEKEERRNSGRGNIFSVLGGSPVNLEFYVQKKYPLREEKSQKTDMWIYRGENGEYKK